MAFDYAPFKLLEIHVSSAQDLPPVSKMLRTFTVAWIHPDQKLSTRIDYQGHTNPTWNYKLVFRVDDKFLRNETAAITFEIYNVAWLRDLPIGTAYLFINHISPPLMQNSPFMRPVALHIRRPSGHLQGILHVGVNLINNNVSSSPLRSELSAFTMENQDIMPQDDHPNLQEQHSIKDEQEVGKGNAIVLQRQPSVHINAMPCDDDFSKGNAIVLQRQPSVHINAMPRDDDFSDGKDGKESKTQTKTMVKMKSFASTTLSMATVMHPLPSEVAFNLKKGLYAPEGEEYGSSIFENWSEPSEVGLIRSKSGEWQMEDQLGLRSKSGEWPTEDQIPLTMGNDIPKTKGHEGHKSWRPKRRKHSGGGLFSCFGKGFEFTFAYGSKAAKNRKKMHHHEKLHVSHQDGKMRRFYI